MSPPVASALVERASELPLPSPATSVVDDTPAEPLLAHRPAPSAQIAGTASGSSAPTARDLFTSANMARRDNNGSRACSLYRELQRRYPTSVEALVSRVSFGRVLLDQLADPSGALGQFDQYLAQTTHTALAEEALFGRATALSQLGRPEAERETWRTLVTRYPSSIYADRARVRMGAIQ
jgi:TolA-binding protein